LARQLTPDSADFGLVRAQLALVIFVPFVSKSPS